MNGCLSLWVYKQLQLLGVYGNRGETTFQQTIEQLPNTTVKTDKLEAYAKMK